MSLRDEFVMLAQTETINFSALCRRFGISRKCGYKWLARYRVGGRSGLADRSRRPHRSPRRSVEAIERAVMEVREGHPAWGPRKIRRVLLNRGMEDAALPSPSTINQILRRHGLIDASESLKHRPFVRFEHERPNELWQMDYKGRVKMRDGGQCHPLTVLDDHSRFAVGVRACGDERLETVRAILIDLFERYGQPRRVLCDNGPPWGNCYDPDERWTALGVWLLSHGIGVSHGRPYHPQTQGKDERFHRTLKAEVLSRVELRDLADAQRRFDAWREVYNHQRPHEALGMATPVTRFVPSDRAYEAAPPPPQYDSGVEVRKVDVVGKISYRGRPWRVGQAFAGQRVGVQPTEVDGVMRVLFGMHEIGRMDLRPAALPCCAGPAVAALPPARHSTEESVTHVSEQL